MDADKIKNFFIFHCEKMILVFVIAASGFLVYQGLQLPNFLDTQQPDRLSSSATQVRADIDINHNDAIIPERKPTIDIVARTEKLYTSVDPTPYELPYPWEGKSPDSIVRRQDPQLLPPSQLIVNPVVTAIAIRGSATDPEDYTLAHMLAAGDLEPAEPVEKIEQPKKRERRSRRGRGGGGYGEEMDEMMMGGGEEEMMEMDMEMEGMYGMEMMGDMSMSEGAGGPNRKFNSKFDFGFRPMATQDKRNPKPQVSWFIAGTAVVPHKKIYEAYELALRDADQYDPLRRDTPMYFNLEVQRADVTDGKPVDQLADEDWIQIWDRTIYTKLGAQYWSGFAPEVVPNDYRDDALTMWIPPVLLDDYRKFATHPSVPMVPHKDLKALENEDDEEQIFEPFSLENEDNSTLIAPGQSGGMDYGMEYGMEDDMMDMEDMGMMGMMGGMGMAMFGRGGIEADPVDYKLVRFYDFAGFKKTNTRPGRKYVYRIRYAVNDPNFPFAQTLQPKISSLAPEVAKRIQGKMADALAKGQRAFQRWSDWSEPSEPVSLPYSEQYFAGPVKPGSGGVWKVGGKEIEYNRDAPTAKILASQYDASTAARIPIKMDIFEGAVLSHKAESADIVDPITLNVLKMTEPELTSSTTVVDLDGGNPLWKPAGDGDLTEPGLMLLFDQSGELKVTDEIGDHEFYRIYTYADERGEL